MQDGYGQEKHGRGQDAWRTAPVSHGIRQPERRRSEREISGSFVVAAESGQAQADARERGAAEQSEIAAQPESESRGGRSPQGARSGLGSLFRSWRPRLTGIIPRRPSWHGRRRVATNLVTPAKTPIAETTSGSAYRYECF